VNCSSQTLQIFLLASLLCRISSSLKPLFSGRLLGGRAWPGEQLQERLSWLREKLPHVEQSDGKSAENNFLVVQIN